MQMLPKAMWPSAVGLCLWQVSGISGRFDASRTDGEEGGVIGGAGELNGVLLQVCCYR